MKNSNLTGGLFDGRGKPQPLNSRAKAKRPNTPEKHIQSSFFAWRNIFKRQHEILNSIFSVPNGIWTFKAIAVSQIRQGLTPGIPDVICLAPSFDKKYHALVIEFKNETNQLSEHQKYFLDFFATLGIRSEVCRSWESAADIVIEHLNLPLKSPVRRGI